MCYEYVDDVSYVSFSCCCLPLLFFFFKQKTAYEMRISDWSSDVCSSDLVERGGHRRVSAADRGGDAVAEDERQFGRKSAGLIGVRRNANTVSGPEIGRASCRERVCKYV